MARGVNVPETMMVINYDLPIVYRKANRAATNKGPKTNYAFTNLPDPESYIHRIGRTGRFGQQGIAISFYGTREEEEMLHFIENSLKGNKTAAPDSIDTPILTSWDPTNLDELQEKLEEIELNVCLF